MNADADPGTDWGLDPAHFCGGCGTYKVESKIQGVIVLRPCPLGCEDKK